MGLWIQMGNLCSNPRPVSGRVKHCNLLCPVFSLDERIPELREIISHGTDHTQTCNHNPLLHWTSNIFTPYNPESPSLQTGDEGNFKSKDKEKPRPLGRGYTGFTFLKIARRTLSPLYLPGWHCHLMYTYFR